MYWCTLNPYVLLKNIVIYTYILLSQVLEEYCFSCFFLVNLETCKYTEKYIIWEKGKKKKIILALTNYSILVQSIYLLHINTLVSSEYTFYILFFFFYIYYSWNQKNIIKMSPAPFYSVVINNQSKYRICVLVNCK